MIDIVIVNWNAGSQLRTCVDSIEKYGSGLIGKIIVVDNGSVDGSDKSVDGLSNVHLIRAGANLGFGKACNLGARYCKSEYLLFLNPDAALYPNTLSRVLAYMQEPKNSDVGICGVQLYDEDGRIARSCARFPSVIAVFAHSLGLDRVFTQISHFMIEWDHLQTRHVDQVIGAFFFVRRNIYEVLNGFDERFFVYFEEVDFSYRASQIGMSSVYLADAQAFHVGGGTSNQVKARRLFYSLRSRLLYAFKHFSFLGALGVLLATLLFEPLSRSVLALSRCSLSSLKETWAAYGMLWCWLPQWILSKNKLNT